MILEVNMTKIILSSIFIFLVKLADSTNLQPNCEELDNGQIYDNPLYKQPECSSKCFACNIEENCDENEQCPISACSKNNEVNEGKKCNVDGYVGSYVILENKYHRVWNFTLQPDEMTSMHRHDYDYSFVAVKPSRLEVFGEDGERLFDFWAVEADLKINGDYLEPVGDIKLPYKVPRIHSARNIGPNVYHELLFENKCSTNSFDQLEATKQEL